MSYTYLPEDTLIQRGIGALLEALGPVEAARFLNLTRGQKVDSVEWHRQWQKGLDKESFLDDVFGGTDPTPSPPPENG